MKYIMSGKRYTKLNEHIFDSITPVSSYLLGIIYTDGHIHKTKYCTRISQSDYNYLDMIKNMFGYDGKIYKYKTSYNLDIRSKHIWKTLKESYKLNSNKTYNCEFPLINNKMINHFIRGCIDGDGCFYKVSKERKQVYTSLLLNRNPFLMDL